MSNHTAFSTYKDAPYIQLYSIYTKGIKFMESTHAYMQKEGVGLHFFPSYVLGYFSVYSENICAMHPFPLLLNLIYTQQYCLLSLETCTIQSIISNVSIA